MLSTDTITIIASVLIPMIGGFGCIIHLLMAINNRLSALEARRDMPAYEFNTIKSILKDVYEKELSNKPPRWPKKDAITKAYENMKNTLEKPRDL